MLRRLTRRIFLTRLIHLAPFLLVAGIIFLYSTDTLTAMGVTQRIQADLLEGRVADDSRWWLLVNDGVAKVRHLCAFIVLGLSAYPLQRRRTDSSRYALTACGAVGLGSEIFQALYTFVRKPAVLDVALDLFAGGLGLGILHLLRKPEVKLHFGWLPRLALLRPVFAEYDSEPSNTNATACK